MTIKIFYYAEDPIPRVPKRHSEKRIAFENAATFGKQKEKKEVSSEIFYSPEIHRMHEDYFESFFKLINKK